MAYSTIVSRLQTDVREATGVGTVYDYKRHVTADQEFNELYVRGSQILTDTGFDDDQKWSSATWAISGSQASVTATGTNKDLSQLNANFASPLSTGTYLLTFTVVANTLNTDAGQVSGSTTVSWDLTDDAGQAVGSGMYFGELVSGGEVSQFKLSVMR